MTNKHNPLGLRGIEFVELSGPDPARLGAILQDFGFSRTLRHERKAVDYWTQHELHALVNTEPGSFAARFQALHGPCISAMGWKVRNAHQALKDALARGAKELRDGDDFRHGERVPAILGIGDSAIYFIDDESPAPQRYASMGFRAHTTPITVAEKGFLRIDHLTNNVPAGTMTKVADFYKEVFGFEEVRYFDIRGKQTGLVSYALRSPCETFCIPINEGTEETSQINEYLREYKGPGVQHLAFLTNDLVASLHAMEGGSIETLDIDPEYYDTVFQRVPNVSEDHETLKNLEVLIDGDAQGYLLQIFTKNLLGPIFVELIQRKNHQSFGEGNFGALFRSIERDQQNRGVL